MLFLNIKSSIIQNFDLKTLEILVFLYCMHSNGKEISLNLTRYISTFAKHATDLILMSLLDQTESFLMSSLLSNADAKSCPKVIPDACRCQFAKNIDKLMKSGSVGLFWLSFTTKKQQCLPKRVSSKEKLSSNS